MSTIWQIAGKEFTVGPVYGRGAQELEDLLRCNEDIFVKDLGYLSVNNQYRFKIRLNRNTPVFNVSILSKDENNIVRTCVNDLLQLGYLVHCDSDWSSPVKPIFLNGKWEICVHYKKLNQITESDQCEVHKLPSVQNVIDSIEGSRYFSKIVLKDAFHQLELTEDSYEKTAFSTAFGQFAFRTYHSGLKNSGAALQSLVFDLLKDISEFNVKSYLGQILVHTKNYQHHMKLLKKLLQRLREFNLKVDVKETCLFMQELVYLGFFIDNDGIWITQDKLTTIMDFEDPRDVHQLRKFLGMLGHYKSYIPNYNQISKPMFDLTDRNVNFHWGRLQQDSFNLVKDMLSNVCPLVGF